MKQGAILIACSTLAVVVLLASCNSTGRALMDDYEAGQQAGLALYEDPSSNSADQRKCQDETRNANGGDPGYLVNSSDEAKLFWAACLIGAEGDDSPTTAEHLESIVSDTDFD